MEGDSGGYDAPFLEPLDKEFECPICLMALRDPLQTPCGHLMCKTCIERITNIRGQFRCPLDNTAVRKEEANPSPWHHRKVLSLQVQCSQSQLGCKWKGTMAEYENHQLACEKQTVECDYSPIGCSVKPMMKKEMAEHEVSAAVAHNRLLLARLNVVERELRAQVREGTKGVFLWKIENWSRVVDDARMRRANFIYSSPFYTDYPGYKISLKLFPDGAEEVRGHFLSIGLALMKGEYDDILEWPFKHSFTLTIMDQQPNGQHVDAMIDPTKKLPIPEKNFGKPKGERNEGRGFPKMISRENLMTRAYIRNNSVLVRAQIH